MKKLFYILGIGLLMASCTEDFKDWADPMSNSENPASASAAVAAAGAIDFTKITADSVLLFTPTYNAEEGTTATNYVTLFNADKSESRTVTVDDQGRAKTTELRDALEALYGPEGTYNVPINVETILNINGQAFRFNSDIEDAVTMAAGMYILQDNELTPMEFVSDGQYTITVPSQDMNFFFLPFTQLNNIEEGKLGCNEETDGFLFGGKLAQGADAYEIIFFEDPDYTQFIITIDMNKMEYDVEGLAYADMIWQAGNANGWGSPAAGLKNKGWKGAQNLFPNARNNDGEYFGFMYLNGDFKFRSGKDNWNAPDWGLDEAIDDYEGFLAVGAGNINAPEGFYMVEANIADMTYKLTPITVGMIGGFNGWASDVVKLTYNTATGAMEAIYEIPAGTEFKFRANDSWDINWGGNLDNLSYDGGNITLAEDGTYLIQLYLTYEGDFHVKFTKQ
jgi:hypothetical protein